MLASLLFCLLPVAVLADPVPSRFSLYGYGEDIDGLEVFYSDGYAYMGNVSTVSSIDVTKVTFSQADNDTSAWVVNAAVGYHVSWDDYYYFLPGDNVTDRQTGFVSAVSSDEAAAITSGFGFYGKTAVWYDDDGSMTTLWYAVAVDNDAGDDLWALNWDSDVEDQVAITLRMWAPPPPPDLERE